MAATTEKVFTNFHDAFAELHLGQLTAKVNVEANLSTFELVLPTLVH